MNGACIRGPCLHVWVHVRAAIALLLCLPTVFPRCPPPLDCHAHPHFAPAQDAVIDKQGDPTMPQSISFAQASVQQMQDLVLYYLYLEQGAQK